MKTGTPPISSTSFKLIGHFIEGVCLGQNSLVLDLEIEQTFIYNVLHNHEISQSLPCDCRANL